MQLILVMHSPKRSNAGNKYFQMNVYGKSVSVTVNPRFAAHKKAAKIDGVPNKQPAWLLQVRDDAGKLQHSGTGAAWEMWRKDGRCYQGNMLIDDKKYLVDIRRIGEVSEEKFELQITPQEEVQLDQL